MWAPSAVNHFSIATHVFTVEFHCYVYHLLDVLPEFSPLPHLSEKSKDFDKFELEPIEITVRRTDGSTSTHTDIMFPKRFGEVLDFYLLDTEPIFFPSYEYHTLSTKGVQLRHCVLQTNREGEMHTLLIPALMLVHELADVAHVAWRTSRGQTNYQLDVLSIAAPPEGAPAPRLAQEQRWGRGRSRSRAVRSGSGAIDLRPRAAPVLNQGDLGTCGVSAIVSLLEFLSGERLSVLFVYWCTRVCMAGAAPHDDAGVELREVLAALAQFGVCREAAWPYAVEHFLHEPPAAAWAEARLWAPQPREWRALASLDEMRATLRELPFFVDVFFSPASYGAATTRSGRVPPPPDDVWDDSCEHTCLVLGCDDERELLCFQNTWGTEWGDGGFGWLPYEYIRRGLFRNAFSWASDELPLDPFHTPRLLDD